MNIASIERNKKACDNGKFCEEYAKRMIPGLEWVGGIYDALLNGRPLDVKGCEAWYDRFDRRSGRRAGQVTFSDAQIKQLKEENGLLFCVVHTGELIIDSFFVPAEKVQNTRQAAWTTMRNLAEAL